MAARIRITKRAVDRLNGDGTDRFHWDHALPGFGLRIRASGRKYYVAQFRAKGRLRRMTLGPHGAISPDEARRRARELISEAKAGRDPSRQREAGRMVVTVADLCGRFLEEYVSTRCKSGTAYEYCRLIDLGIRPKIGGRTITEIQRSDIAELHHAMRAAPYQANRTLSVLSKMFNLAELWGVRPDGSNPCRHVTRYKEKPRERFLSSEEFQRLGGRARRNSRGGLRDPLGGHRDPAAYVDRMPTVRDSAVALGARGLEGSRTAVAGHQDRRADDTACSIGSTSARNPASRGRQSVGHRRPQARSTSHGLGTPVEKDPRACGPSRRANSRPPALLRLPRARAR